MIDIADLDYDFIVIRENGKRISLRDYVETLGWEENKGELSVRITVTLYNGQTKHGLVSSLLKPGCLAGVIAGTKNTKKEAVRGYVTDWKPVFNSDLQRLECVCYDELYNLQQSEDNLYFPAGTGTKSAVLQILKKWSIPLESYDGPNATHGKLVYKNEALSDILLDLLDDAAKKGETECFYRAVRGKVRVLKKGNNKDIYHFTGLNTKMVNHQKSLSDLVTRVKVIGRENGEGRAKVEAVVNGDTSFGIRQKLYIRDQDDSLASAKAAAQKLLEEKGKAREEITVEAPDVPFLRKWDQVHLEAGGVSDYFLVEGIRHDAEGAVMTMDLVRKKEGLTKR